jgi:sulfate-transporting ATPase
VGATVAKLSGGEKRRVALCRLLLSKPDMLLLDEPTNHLDAESVEWLEQFLLRFPGTVIAVTHDRYFLDNAAEWILELDRGYGIPWKGNYSSWLEQKEARLKTEAKQEAARIKAMQKELEWVRQNAKGRRQRARRVSPASRSSPPTSTSRRTRRRKSSFPSPSGSATPSSNCRREQGYGERLLIDNLSFNDSGRRDRRDHRPERRRQDRRSSG